MRLIVKSRSQATAERLGGCGFPGCHAVAACSNCIQCVEHHGMQKHCGFVEPLPVKFDRPDANLSVRTGIAMLVVDDDDPVLNGKPETTFSNATVHDIEEMTNA